MESIQLAQMLADLSDLNAAQEAKKAVAVVNANKTLAPPTSHPATGKSSPQQNAQATATNRHHQRVHTSTGISRTASPAAQARFDAFGRRILTPPMTRANSSQGSIPGTPRANEHDNEDISSATTLMQLYEIRARLKQQDNSGLNKARERVSALHARQMGEKKEVFKGTQSPRYTYPRSQ